MPNTKAMRDLCHHRKSHSLNWGKSGNASWKRQQVPVPTITANACVCSMSLTPSNTRSHYCCCLVKEKQASSRRDWPSGEKGPHPDDGLSSLSPLAAGSRDEQERGGWERSGPVGGAGGTPRSRGRGLLATRAGSRQLVPQCEGLCVLC